MKLRNILQIFTATLWLNFEVSFCFLTNGHLSKNAFRRHPQGIHKSANGPSISVDSKTDLRYVMEVAEIAAKKAGDIIKSNSGASFKDEKSNFRDLVTEYDGMCEKLIVETVKEHFPHHLILGEESVAAGASASISALNSKLLELSEVSTEKDDPMLWIIDPIDGTTNFAMGLPLCVVSIAIYFEGEIVAGCIYDPAHDECFTAILGDGAKMNGRDITVRKDSELNQAVINVGFPPDPKALEVCTRGADALRTKVRGMRMIVSAALVLSWIACGRLHAFAGYNLNSWDIAAGCLILQEANGQVTDLRGTPYELETRNMLASNSYLHAHLLNELRAADAVDLDV